MEIIHIDKKTAKYPMAVALGYFDGLHMGHQAVILNAVHYAKQHHIRSAVITFSINPKFFLKKLATPYLLTPMSEKIAILKKLGVDQLLILPFDETIACMKPEDFIKKYLIEEKVCYVSTGFDFRFGKNGAGNITLLEKYEEVFKLDVTPKLRLGTTKIGATQIRDYLLQGDVQEVCQMLGRPYSLSGMVIKGNQKGRSIGFPTANIELKEQFLVPKKGVYAVKAYVGKGSYRGMCNIGHNPTFNYTDGLSIEVYLLDFNEDIYGETIRIEFIKYLRSEQKFQSIDDLMKQLKGDCKAVREIIL